MSGAALRFVTPESKISRALRWGMAGPCTCGGMGGGMGGDMSGGMGGGMTRCTGEYRVSTSWRAV